MSKIPFLLDFFYPNFIFLLFHLTYQPLGMPTVLITGGLGYIGSHTAVTFIQKGYDIIIIDDLNNADISVLKHLTALTGKKPKFYQIYLKNIEDIRRVFRENNIDGVIHFAAFKAVGESCNNPFMYYENNVGGGINLYMIMNEYGVKKNRFFFKLYRPGYNKYITSLGGKYS